MYYYVHTYTHTQTYIHPHTHKPIWMCDINTKFKCVCVCWCVCVCVCVCVFVRVLLSNKYHIKGCFSNFFHHCPHKLTVLLLKLSWRFLRWIRKVAQTTLDLQSKWYDLKSNRKSHYFALIWYQIHIHFQQRSYLDKFFPDCTIFFYTDCSILVC